jgi:hypothetical protein
VFHGVGESLDSLGSVRSDSKMLQHCQHMGEQTGGLAIGRRLVATEQLVGVIANGQK